GLGIGSEDVGVGENDKTGSALTAQEYDTLVTAFEANNASTAGDKAASKTCAATWDNGKVCGCSVKAGNAFDGTLSSSKIKTDASVTMAPSTPVCMWK
ncbi:MAG: hypothetical protein ACTJLK_02285, partial [Anaplasma sp.]